MVTNSEIVTAIKGLLKIARTAMPDTYYATDSRVKRAKKLLKELGADDDEKGSRNSRRKTRK